MAASAAHADLSAVDDHVGPRIAQHIKAAVRKCRRGSGRRSESERIEGRGAVGAKHPEGLVPEVPGGSGPFLRSTVDGGGRQQVAMIVQLLEAKFLHPPIV